MKRAGLARRRLLVAMTPRGRLVVDVGADHGHVAQALGAIATERMPQRIGRAPVRWVVADGLSCFARVEVAVIAGMGALKIAEILERGPSPEVLVAHAPDDPPRLRTWLAAHGWRIEVEGLAPEAGRFAEVIRAVPGVEPASGLLLELGPRLLEGDDPLLRPHLEQLLGHFGEIARQTAGHAEDVHRWASSRVDFLTEALTRRGWR